MRNNGRLMTVEERHQRNQQLVRTMELLVHASACNNTNCSSSNCHKVKTLFIHGLVCTQKATGGCALCRRMWTLLQVHAKQCNQSNCPVPRCKDLNEEYRQRRELNAEDEDAPPGFERVPTLDAACD